MNQTNFIYAKRNNKRIISIFSVFNIYFKKPRRDKPPMEKKNGRKKSFLCSSSSLSLLFSPLLFNPFLSSFSSSSPLSPSPYISLLLSSFIVYRGIELNFQWIPLFSQLSYKRVPPSLSPHQNCSTLFKTLWKANSV